MESFLVVQSALEFLDSNNCPASGSRNWEHQVLPPHQVGLLKKEKNTGQLGAVAHIRDPSSFSGSRVRRITIGGQPGSLRLFQRQTKDYFRKREEPGPCRCRTLTVSWTHRQDEQLKVLLPGNSTMARWGVSALGPRAWRPGSAC